MSTGANVFIRSKMPEKELVKILHDDFLVLLERKRHWFLDFIEIGLTHRSESRGSFVGHVFRPYDFLLFSTTYAWSTYRGSVRFAHFVVMDVLAQALAVKLKTRTMVYCPEDGDFRRYRYIRSMKRNDWNLLLDEKTGKPPVGFFGS